MTVCPIDKKAGDNPLHWNAECPPWAKLRLGRGEQHTARTGDEALMVAVTRNAAILTATPYGSITVASPTLFSIPPHTEFTLTGIADARIITCAFDKWEMASCGLDLEKLRKVAWNPGPQPVMVTITDEIRMHIGQVEVFLVADADSADKLKTQRRELIYLLRASYPKRRVAALLAAAVADESPETTDR